MNEEIKNFLRERYKKIEENREEILEAFVAKYGCQPEELMLIQADLGRQFFPMTGEPPEKLEKCPACGLFKRPI